MACLKIVFLAGDRQIVLYGQGMKEMWQVETHVLERLGQQERLRLETAQFRKFWIDEEGDRVEIMNNVDYEFFLKRAGGHKIPKIYFEARYPTKETQQEEPQSSTSSPTEGRDNLSVHTTVTCDNCNMAPVRGFRYKCLQCPNFDLCMKCEADMCHSEHLMIRIPYAGVDMEFELPLFGFKRRQRRFAAAAAAAAAASGAVPAAGCCEGQKGEGKNRHHRHHRRHCSGGPGLWSNFYDMMQGLAEGGAVPQTSATNEGPQKQQTQEPSAPSETSATAQEPEVAATVAAALAAGSQSKETNTSPDRSTNTPTGAQNCPFGSTSAPPSFENLQNLIDPNFMKAGIQILNNFSEMFGKILDPTVVPDAASRPNSTSGSTIIDLVGGESPASATPPPTANGTPNQAVASKETSAAGSGIVTPMETEASTSSAPVAAPEALPRSRNSQSEENDWTMIDNNVATSSAAVAPTASTSTVAAAAAAVAAASPPLDFAKLSQQLQTHIENEKKQSKITAAVANPPPAYSPTSPVLVATQVAGPPLTAVPAPTPAVVSAPIAPTVPIAVAPYPIERRAIAVFHPDPRINDSIHAMMAMGFSNEGANLTQLLESVNGNIPEALDVMSYVQRT